MLRPFFLPLTALFWPLVLPAQSPAPLLRHPGEIRIQYLDSLNSAYRETNLSITPDGRYLFFQSQRGGMPWSSGGFGTFRGRPRYDGDIWYSRREAGTWQAATCLGPAVNTGRGEDEPVVSADGQRIIFQSWKPGWERGGGPYYQAELQGADWQSPRGLGGGINAFFVREFNRYQAYATDGVAVSVDGKTFLVAAGPEYEEALDIYISRKNDGQWSYLQKAAISTDGDERSLFIAADNRTLYFASDARGGMGGLDIFKTVLKEDGDFGDIYNLGAPFNTARDDYGFIITASGREAYFVRDGDIYFADLTEADPRIRPLPTLIVRGRVTDETDAPLSARVRLLDPQSGALLAQSATNALSGEYAIAVARPSGALELVFSTDEHPPARRPVWPGPGETFEELIIDERFSVKSAETTAPEPDTSFSPPTILFDFDRSDIKPEFEPALRELCAYLQAHPAARVYLTGHTDDRGGNVYNLRLGQRRAEKVRDYLLNAGVANAIQTTTRGETDPVEDNRSERGAYRNRRVAITLTPGTPSGDERPPSPQ